MLGFVASVQITAIECCLPARRQAVDIGMGRRELEVETHCLLRRIHGTHMDRAPGHRDVPPQPLPLPPAASSAPPRAARVEHWTGFPAVAPAKRPATDRRAAAPSVPDPPPGPALLYAPRAHVILTAPGSQAGAADTPPPLTPGLRPLRTAH